MGALEKMPCKNSGQFTTCTTGGTHICWGSFMLGCRQKDMGLGSKDTGSTLIPSFICGELWAGHLIFLKFCISSTQQEYESLFYSFIGWWHKVMFVEPPSTSRKCCFYQDAWQRAKDKCFRKRYSVLALRLKIRRLKKTTTQNSPG